MDYYILSHSSNPTLCALIMATLCFMFVFILHMIENKKRK